MEKILIQNSKGENIATVIHRPATPSAKLAVLCPGYLDTKDYDHLIKLAEALTEQGYTAVRFDPTGVWESEGDISEYTTTQHLEDIRCIIEFMRTKSNYEHILVGGHSRGGMLSLLYAAQDSRVSTVLGIMPSSNYILPLKQREQWQTTGIESHRRNIPGTAEKKEFQVPFSYVLDREPYDVLGELKNVHARIVLIAGELDTLIPPADVQEIFERANEPKKFVLVKGVGHDYRLNPVEVEKVTVEIVQTLLEP